MLIWTVNTQIPGYSNPIRLAIPPFSPIHVYSPHYMLLHLISLFLVLNTTIIVELKVKLSLSMSPCHDHALTLNTAYTKYCIHRVQHTLSKAYTNYSICQVQHTPNSLSTQVWVFSLPSHDYEITPECNFSFWCASKQDQPPQASSPHPQNGKWFRSYISTTQLFWTAPPILSEAPRSSWAGWMQNDVLLRCSKT